MVVDCVVRAEGEVVDMAQCPELEGGVRDGDGPREEAVKALLVLGEALSDAPVDLERFSHRSVRQREKDLVRGREAGEGVKVVW